MELRKIAVDFNQEEHTYVNTETGVELKGITSTLMRRLFPDKYDGIPAEILKKAAEKGTLVHEEIELAEGIGIDPQTEEAQNYLRLKEKYGLKYMAGEYTVSDMEHYATNIDGVYEVDEGLVDIADYKTTSKLDKGYVSWQLSVCARFFELNNPGIKVRNLYAIWLRGEVAEIVAVQRQTDEDVDALIQADLNNEPYEYKTIVPEYVADAEMQIIMLTRRIKDYQEQLDALKAEVMAKMVENDEKSVDTGALLITVVPESVRRSFDSSRFKKEQAEVYEQYMKESVTKASLKVTLRSN